ncbi:MAG TPA: XRE family transcriptional regulator [Gammaproteobacteria bacterium]|nr:XRE family transcriptional regulator [Gammaproteobacteria bacterium]
MAIAGRLARNIRRRRGEAFQRAFARKLGISQSTLARIENAGQNTTLKTLQQIMKVLECGIGELFDLVQPPPECRVKGGDCAYQDDNF